ncbi:hypothetical protein HK102_010384, partial [Quaeritorhiza haematococci]
MPTKSIVSTTKTVESYEIVIGPGGDHLPKSPSVHNPSLTTTSSNGRETHDMILPHIPLSFTFRDLSFAVMTDQPAATEGGDSLHAEGTEKRTEKKGWFGKKKQKRVLISGISGHVKPGEVLAIMGPSGGGKSTLLDILANRKNKSHGDITGEIILNNSVPISKIGSLRQRLLGYVMQHDVFTETLTLQETLLIAAELKLPRRMTRAEKMERVNEVIEELGLTKSRHTKVGGPQIRGLSGGEKRRLGIGMELLSSPSILLLDEPTSGLSSTDALSVMTTIKSLARKNRTVILTIHQPRSEIFDMFDKLLLLSKGRATYFGPSADAVQYFEELGYECPFGWNVADFLLDIISSDPLKPSQTLLTLSKS